MKNKNVHENELIKLDRMSFSFIKKVLSVFRIFRK